MLREVDHQTFILEIIWQATMFSNYAFIGTIPLSSTKPLYIFIFTVFAIQEKKSAFLELTIFAIIKKHSLIKTVVLKYRLFEDYICLYGSFI